MSWLPLLSMDGYAPYVWGAYVLTLAALAGELFLLWRRGRAVRRGDDGAAPHRH